MAGSIIKWVALLIISAATGVICTFGVLFVWPELIASSPRTSGQLNRADASAAQKGFSNEIITKTYCSYGSSEQFAVEVVVVSKGGIKTPVQISDQQRTRQVDIDVTREDQPIFLVLAAYDPVIWRVRTTPKAKIVAALVSGYYRQALVGLPQDTFVVQSSVEGNECQWRYLTGARDAKVKGEVDQKLRSLIGRSSDNFLYQRTGKEPILIGPQDGTSGLPEVDEPVIPAGMKIDEPPRLYGEEILRDMIERNLMRYAQGPDVVAWLRGAPGLSAIGQRMLTGMLLVSPETKLTSIFVALQPLQIPKGMPNSIKIIVPDGVPLPTGELENVDVWRMAPNACIGRGCFEVE